MALHYPNRNKSIYEFEPPLRRWVHGHENNQASVFQLQSHTDLQIVLYRARSSLQVCVMTGQRAPSRGKGR